MLKILCEKYINIWFGFPHDSIVRSVGKNPWKKLDTFYYGYRLIYIDDRNIRGVHLCQDNLCLLQSSEKVLCDSFISCLNSNFLVHPHPSQMWT